MSYRRIIESHLRMARRTQLSPLPLLCWLPQPGNLRYCAEVCRGYAESCKSMMDRKWWLVIAGCVTHAVDTGFSYFGMSAFFPSFEREFGWSRTAISGAFSLARIECRSSA